MATVNQVPYDFASIEFDIDGLLTVGLRSLSYEHGMEVEKNFGASREAINRTDGVYSAEDAEVTLLMSDYRALIAQLGNGYMKRVFPAAAVYGHDGGETYTDELIDCRIIMDAHDHSQGPEGLEVSITLSVMKVKPNGVDPVNA